MFDQKYYTTYLKHFCRSSFTMIKPGVSEPDENAKICEILMLCRDGTEAEKQMISSVFARNSVPAVM